MSTVESLIQAYEEYLALIVDEINELAPFADKQGWKTTRFDAGVQARKKIQNLKDSILYENMGKVVKEHYPNGFPEANDGNRT